MRSEREKKDDRKKNFFSSSRSTFFSLRSRFLFFRSIRLTGFDWQPVTEAEDAPNAPVHSDVSLHVPDVP
jgi:hypothetical protein